MGYVTRTKDDPGDVGRAADQQASVDNDAFFRTALIHVQVEPFGWIAQTNCAVGNDAVTPVVIPLGLTGLALIWAECAVETAGVTNTMDIMIRKNAVDMLSTVLTLDSAETNSSTAAAPVVIKSDGSEDVVTGDVIHFDFDAVHATPAKGCIVTLRFG